MDNLQWDKFYDDNILLIIFFIIVGLHNDFIDIRQELEKRIKLIR